jgi:hypothetical protein
VQSTRKFNAQSDPKSKSAKVQPGPKSGPPATVYATTPEVSVEETGRQGSERAECHETGKNGTALPAPRRFQPLRSVRAEVLTSEDEAPTPVVATLEVPAEVTTLPSDEQLGQQLREELRSHALSIETTVETALRLGEVLLHAKKRIPAGRFWAWFHEQAQGRCGQHTAQLYMKLARDASRVREIQGSDAQNSAPLPVYKILKALSKPRDTSPPVEADESGDESPGRSSARERTSTRATANRGARDPKTDARRTDEGDHGQNRDEATGSARKAKSTRSARGDADTGARKPASEASGDEPTGGDEPEPADEPWLDSFPIRKQLSNPAAFDCDALAHRELRCLLEGLHAHRLTEEDLRRARSGSSNWVSKRLALTLLSICDVFDPATRVLCEKCQGSGASSSMDMECTVCDGAGFLPPLATTSGANPPRS